jgi:hypothetical protein
MLIDSNFKEKTLSYQSAIYTFYKQHPANQHVRVGPNGQQWEPTDHDRICFLHFITGMSLIVLNICKCLK